MDYQGWLSNTEILSKAGFTDFSMVRPEYLEASIRVGNAVAEATQLLDEHEEFWRIEQWREYSWIWGYVEAWKAFKRDFAFKPILREERISDEQRKITTKPDANGMSRYGMITVQIKSCVVHSWVALQLACEEHVINIHRGLSDGLGSSPNRFGVQLMADGKYRPKRFSYKNDLRVFLAADRFVRSEGKDKKAARSIEQWKARHK